MDRQRLIEEVTDAFYEMCDGTKCCECDYRELEEIEMCGINFTLDYLAEREVL